MFGTHDLALFLLTGVLLNITPGPDMLFVMGRSAAEGPRAGIIAAFGIGVGCFVHILAAALGVSALLVASSTAFGILKIVGAAYLCYVGLQLLLTRRQPVAAAGPTTATHLRSAFAQGFLTNALNPKVAMFFLAFVPQFIQADSNQKALAFLLLGTIFNCTGTIWNVCVAVATARAGTRLRQSAFVIWLNRGIGAIFIMLGIRLASAELKSS